MTITALSDFDGYQKVIDACDAVMIACASKFHPDVCRSGDQSRQTVFVEKPHGIDPVGVRRMAGSCDLAKKKGLSILSGLQSRFNPAGRKRSSGFTTARSATSWPCSRCSCADPIAWSRGPKD